MARSAKRPLNIGRMTAPREPAQRIPRPSCGYRR